MRKHLEFQWQGQRYVGSELMAALFAPDRREQYHPRLWREFGILCKDRFLRRYIRHTQSLFDLAHEPIEGQTILDCGAGFGLTAIFLALLGAKAAHGLEFQQNHIDTFAAFRDVFPADLPVFMRQGDAAAMPYEDNSFDVVLSVEAISHYRDTNGFLKEVHRVLRPGGILIISDANNGANPWRAYRTKRLWAAFENGSERGGYYGHKIGKSFLQQRREIITEAFPFLDQDVVDDLARGTSGLNRGEILAVVQYYVDVGAKPQHFYQFGTCPLDPFISHYAEFLFHPLRLAKEIGYYGFDAHVYSYFGGSRGGWVAKVNDWITQKVPTSLTIWLAHTFRIVARNRV